MSALFIWSDLQKLVAIDRDIQRYEAALSQQASTYHSLRQTYEMLVQNHTSLQTQAHNLLKNTDMLEREIAELKQTHQAKNHTLEMSSNPKEYHALEKELAVLENAIEEKELQLLQLWEEKERLEKESSVLAEKVTEHQRALDECAAHYDKEKKEAEATVEKKRAEWTQIAQTVPPSLVKAYEQMRARVKDPVVPLIKNSCSACFYSLLPQDALHMTGKTVVRCHGCYRFLFIPSQDTPAHE